MSSLRLLFTLPLALLFLGAACSPPGPAADATKGPDHYFPIALGDQPLKLQLALSDAEQERGLMFRDPLPERHGMLFVFRAPGPRAFWMRNTKIPLDLGYFDPEGRLLETHALYPFDETSVPSRSRNIQFVLEMNQGAFRDLGIRPGSRLSLDEVAAAIEARGLSSERYGLR